MRKLCLAFVLTTCLLFPSTAFAQPPTPPPGILEICYPEGNFHPVECAKAIWDATGAGGILALALLLLVGYVILTPGGKAIQAWVQNNVEEKLYSFSKKPLQLSDLRRREVETEYLKGLETSETLRQPDEIASRFDRYLTTLNKRENPLKPSEDRDFVELESGLSIPPRIGLSVKVQSEQTKSFAEQKTFNSLEEAVNYADEQSGHPYPSLALLGEPGAGKSTLLRKFARQVVAERLADPSKPLPIFVSLSAHKNGTPLTFLRRHWSKVLGFDGFEENLAQGKVWLFLDGLNEMPRSNYDVRVTEWRAFLREHFVAGNGNRALVACRTADYGEGVDVPRLLIHAMNAERIQQFLRKRAPNHADALWTALKKDRDEGRGAMYELAQTPFWLVMISRLSGKDGLPRNRAGLISRFIREWLDYEGSRPQGRITSELQRDAFWECMTQLAWVGLSRSQNYTFRDSEARKLLQTNQSSLGVADVLGLAKDCSLLSEESGGSRFHHQLLQEYFAAHELAQRFLAGKNLTKLWKTPWRRWKFVQSQWDPLPPPPLTGWEEALVLAAGMLNREQAEKLILRVLNRNPPLAARCILESGVEIGDVVIESAKACLQSDLQNLRVRLPARLASGRALAKLGDPRLLKRMNELENKDGGKISFIVPEWMEIPEGSFQMGTTPGQRRLLAWQRAQSTPDELHPHRVFISGFKMARYPVTVAEYRYFMQAGGYEKDEYWREENALRWRNAPPPFEESYAYRQTKLFKENAENILPQLDTLVKQGRISQPQADAFREYINMPDDDARRQWEENEKEKRNDDGRVVQPWLWEDQRYTVDNQPLIGVSWYEACAYSAWLTEVLKGKQIVGEEEIIRLPTEAEWEKAARGDTGRLWTWGNLWRASYANTLEGRVMQPSTVGSYPKNESPYRIADMIGNVWEWCLDWYDETEYNEREGKEVKDPCRVKGGDARVARGGSWHNNRHYARCSYRDRHEPDNFLNYLGFRLVCSPSSPLNSESLFSESLNQEEQNNVK